MTNALLLAAKRRSGALRQTNAAVGWNAYPADDLRCHARRMGLATKTDE